MNKCSMLVIAQHELKFRGHHQPHPTKKVAAWLKKKTAMECIIWAAEIASYKEDSKNDEGGSYGDEEVIEEG